MVTRAQRRESRRGYVSNDHCQLAIQSVGGQSNITIFVILNFLVWRALAMCSTSITLRVSCIFKNGLTASMLHSPTEIKALIS